MPVDARTNKSAFDGLPSDLRPVDSQVKNLLEKAADAARAENREASRKLLEDALNATQGGEPSDKALVEAWIAAWEFFEGHFAEADKYYDLALADAEVAGNHALMADLLASKSSRLRM